MINLERNLVSVTSIYPGVVEEYGLEIESTQELLRNHPEVRVVSIVSYTLRLCLQCKKTGRSVGRVGPGMPGVDETFGLGYEINEEYRGQGLLSALLQDYMHYSPEKVFSLLIFSSNKDSLKVAIRNGFSEVASEYTSTRRFIKYKE